jgi:hypothetical protein
MACVLGIEKWAPDLRPGELSYFCGTWHLGDPNWPPPYTDRDFPKRARADAVARTREFLDRNMGWFFPNAVGQGRFDLTLLTDPTDPENIRATPGDVRLDRQWFIVNAAPSDEYTLAVPGSDKYRLAANESGFANLYLCGDWTNFGLNIGHVEGAVTSGLVAAQALLTGALGQTALREIYRDVET